MNILQKKFTRTLLFSLFLISLTTILSSSNAINLLQRLFILILVSFSSEYIIARSLKTNPDLNKLSFPFILFLVVDIKRQLFLSVFALILSHFFDRFVRFRGRSIFNSLTLSLFVLNIIGLKINWWGPNTGLINISMIVIFGSLIGFFYGKLRHVFLFFLMAISINLLLTINPLYSIKQVFIPGFIFFTFFILTWAGPFSTYGKRVKNIYVTLASILSVIIPKFGFFTDPLITSLVITDFTIFSIRLFSPGVLPDLKDPSKLNEV